MSVCFLLFVCGVFSYCIVLGVVCHNAFFGGRQKPPFGWAMFIVQADSAFITEWLISLCVWEKLRVCVLSATDSIVNPCHTENYDLKWVWYTEHISACTQTLLSLPKTSPFSLINVFSSLPVNGINISHISVLHKVFKMQAGEEEAV